jgi:hypothetical protein
VREVIYQRSLPLATRHLRIAAARTGESSGAIGAGVMVIEHALDPDRLDSAPFTNAPITSAPPATETEPKTNG